MEWLKSPMRPGETAATEFFPRNDGQPHPSLNSSPLPPNTKNTAAVSTNVSHSLSLPRFRLGHTGFVVNLFPSHEMLSTHTKRGCVGRREDTHMHSTWYMDQPGASTRFICVNFTYFSMIIVRNCWNLKGCVTVLLK